MKAINRKIKIFTCVAILVCTFSNISIASPENRIFYNINNLYGTSLRGANSVTKDDKGFIWISSKTGILRLTKDDHRKYLLPYVTTDVLTVNLIYENSQLIAYTNNGQFFQYDPLYDEFNLVCDIRQIMNSTHVVVQNVLVDGNGTYFIASSLGLYKYTNEGKLILLTKREINEQHIEWNESNRDMIFLGRGDGIWEMDSRNGKTRRLCKNDDLNSFNVSELFYDKDMKNLWIGTSSGDLFFYNAIDSIMRRADIERLPDHPILAIEANTDSTVMLGFDGQGLWELNREGTRVLNVYREDVDNPSSLSGNGVYDIYSDRNQRVWVCTYSGGVSFFEQSNSMVTQIKHQINYSNSLVNNTVNDVFEDRNGNLWFATNNGISKWNVSSDKWTSFYENETDQARVFLSVYEDTRGNIWAGTWSSGIFVFDGDTGREIKRLSQADRFGDFIFDVTEDAKGDIWIVGVVENVIRYDTEVDEFQEYGTQPVYVIREYNSEEMLLGCSYGLVLLNKQNRTVKTLLDGYIIHDILIRENEIWCATSGGGLIRYNVRKGIIKKYTIDSGLPSNFVNSVIYSDGYLWLGTESGLCRFNPDEEDVLTYSSIIPLANASFNQDASCRLSDGKLIWGTNDGAIMFDPNFLRSHKTEGTIFFQDIVVSGKTIRDSTVFDLKTPVDSLNEITLAYHQNTVTFELLPIGVSASESKFSWKIEGIDEAWSAPTSNRLLTFANLPSGEFELKIRLHNNSLSQIMDERSIGIKIKPPFWKAWWFYLFGTLFVTAIFYFFFRYHINLIQQLHSEEKIRFFANTAHEIRTSLTLISGPVEGIRKEAKLSEKGKYYLNLAVEQINNLSKVATQLLDFQKFDKGKEQLNLKTVNVVDLIGQRKMMFETYAQKKNIQLLFYPEPQSCIAAIDSGMIEKVVDNLISNAIKYSHEGGTVIINFSCNKKTWIMTVKDQGIGISQKGQKQLFKEFYRSENAVNSEVIGSGIGLLMVKNYVEKHGGSITCLSRENEGSTFKIEIPLRRKLSGYPVSEKGFVESESHIAADNASDTIVVKENTGKQKSLSILIVEDNEKLKNFLEVSLSDEFNVTSASNGREAWELITKKFPDIVVSDIMMPEMDGFELCRKIKSTYDTSHIPLILLTALTEKAEQLHGLGLGADAYLTKPFDISLLIGRIKSIVLNRKTIREKALKLIDRESNGPIIENELNDKFVKKALEVVKSNISNPQFGKDEFAFEMNVSSSLLYKKVKSLTDQSPSDFIKSVRLNYALELLQSGEHTVTEISEKAGFSSLGYFSTVFKKFYGKLPTDILNAK
ncbi:hybrid sensor histidine kinase/response regulator transcription factor [Anaerophaga thermohalophila]|jgi:signal transduction histidine kinase/ligand-binding sensor domain-containing protein/DNA-binding NarL/FixJ family response regulator|uniref:hybrid sensor histidine kinase/response regulator transcription factor n=1 Tax=Anaerophaga thermohalophila TaxID=177400 RepID=UPI0002E941C0|nr:response regulator [Anaerophaga thermohalophila]